MEEFKMASLIQYAVLFVVLAVLFGVFGKKKIAGISWDIAKWLVIIFIVIAIITFIL
jgi:uncharacterized membrane protein YtjA (UPF0391 family)